MPSVGGQGEEEDRLNVKDGGVTKSTKQPAERIDLTLN